MKDFFLKLLLCVLLILIVFAWIMRLDVSYDYRVSVNEFETYPTINFDDATDLNERYLIAGVKNVSLYVDPISDALHYVIDGLLDVGSFISGVDRRLLLDSTVHFDSYLSWVHDVQSFSSKFETQYRANCTGPMVAKATMNMILKYDLCRFVYDSSDDQYVYYHCYFVNDPRRLQDESAYSDISYYDKYISWSLEELHLLMSQLGITHTYNGVYYSYSCAFPKNVPGLPNHSSGANR